MDDKASFVDLSFELLKLPDHRILIGSGSGFCFDSQVWAGAWNRCVSVL